MTRNICFNFVETAKRAVEIAIEQDEVEEVKLAKEGKVKLHSAKDFLNEL